MDRGLKMTEIVNWLPGIAPVTVVMISLNEAHNLEGALQSLSGWAHEVILVDSFSSDETVSIALRYGVTVVQRRFRGFGDQWNFALTQLPIASAWTMKLDPDERLTTTLKESILDCISSETIDSLEIKIRLWFMGVELPVEQSARRVWRSGRCKFSDVTVNEHAVVEGAFAVTKGWLQHKDSPNLEHWLNKQNKYTTSEAISQFLGNKVALPPKLFGTSIQRRMWLKRNFWKVPGRYVILFLYHLLVLGAWRAGKAGRIWSHLRVEVYRLWEFKRLEMEWSGKISPSVPFQVGVPDSRVRLYD